MTGHPAGDHQSPKTWWSRAMETPVSGSPRSFGSAGTATSEGFGAVAAAGAGAA
ncbi:hypothetical protein [Kitasatospora sp. NPDC056531]|uniref:hypothetical protein n=1 Tax=Kitasatospora sp. NPDC056531 TaxID=3345856 RepID=UPI00367D384E